MRIRAFSLLRKTVAREDTDTTKQSQSEMVSAAKCVLGDTPLGLVRHPPEPPGGHASMRIQTAHMSCKTSRVNALGDPPPVLRHWASVEGVGGGLKISNDATEGPHAL